MTINFGAYVRIFDLQEFGNAITESKAKALYEATDYPKDKALFVLTHEVADSFIQDQSLPARREALAEFQRSEEIQRSYPEVDETVIQEIPFQRWYSDKVAVLRPLYVSEHVLVEIEAMTNNLDREEKNELCRRRVDGLEVPMWARMQLHTWAVILCVESIYRTVIEAIAFVIHKLAPSYFPNYGIEEREEILNKQWESLQLMAHSVIFPLDNLGVDDEVYTTSNVRRGTPYTGRAITASACTSDFWPIRA